MLDTRWIRSPAPSLAAIAALALAFLASPARGQVLAQLTTAAVASEGEGALFMLAGNDAFRTGAAARFRLARVADLGVQLGLDGACGESFFGGGLDVKLAILERSDRLPLGIAVDAAGGWLESADHARYSLDVGVLVSGAVGRTRAGSLEPFLTLALDVERIEDADEGARAADGCPCSWIDHETDTSFFVRAGVKIPLSRDGSLLVETALDGRDLIGAGFNLVF